MRSVTNQTSKPQRLERTLLCLAYWTLGRGRSRWLGKVLCGRTPGPRPLPPCGSGIFCAQLVAGGNAVSEAPSRWVWSGP